MELVEGGNMCGEFGVIVYKMQILVENVKVGLWLVDIASNSPKMGVSQLLEEGLFMQNKLDCTRRRKQTSIMDRLVFQTLLVVVPS